jgi:hypothetical protein
MWDNLPLHNQPYNEIIFKVAVNRLFDQAPAIVAWALDSMMLKFSGSCNSALLRDLLPMNISALRSSYITIRYPDEQKVSYYWVCQKLIQLLLWNENSPVKNMSVYSDLYRINIEDVYNNILKVEQIISDYANHPKSKSSLLGLDRSFTADNSALPSYQNVIGDQDSVGTSNAHLTQHNQQYESLPETSGHTHEHSANNSFRDFNLSYRFDGSSNSQPRDFINDYDRLAIRNKWSPEEKREFFSNNLEKDALEWYLSCDINLLASWQALKDEFMRKYF